MDNMKKLNEELRADLQREHDATVMTNKAEKHLEKCIELLFELSNKLLNRKRIVRNKLALAKFVSLERQIINLTESAKAALSTPGKHRPFSDVKE